MTMTTDLKSIDSLLSLPETRSGWRWSRRWWSGLAAGSVAGVMAVVWGLALWDQTTGWTSVDVMLWTIAGLLYLALFDGILSLLWWLLRGVTRVFHLETSPQLMSPSTAGSLEPSFSTSSDSGNSTHGS